jgi:bifunctional N-acetylglucosamine-1-phosphate-uridyltransferase/glucosamine-1-phosphate-acetyltransferase GlmU-like protein
MSSSDAGEIAVIILAAGQGTRMRSSRAKVLHEICGRSMLGHVLERAPHPDADRLALCRVEVGDEVLEIVCGAPNVAAGQKVAVAPVGARLTCPYVS